MDIFSKYKIEHNSLSEMAYNKIKSLIIDNSLKPGEKIIQEKMAADLGISKIPLIQALTVLHNEGLLEKIPRKGFYVKKFLNAEIADIFDIRSALEMLCVSKVIEKMNPEIEKTLKSFMDDFKIYYQKKNSKKYYETDVKFHQFLIDAADNEILKSIIDNFNILLICYTKGFVLELNESYSQHNSVIESLLEKDTEKAEAAIRQHILRINEKFKLINNN
jgi:DNA-binding GntR family transcriptional regulator